MHGYRFCHLWFLDVLCISSDRKPPGVGRGRGRGGRDDGPAGRQGKGIGRGMDDGGAKAGGRGKGGSVGKPGGSKGTKFVSFICLKVKLVIFSGIVGLVPLLVFVFVFE